METKLTLITQNLRTSGSQKGIQGERGGGINEVYSRSRRFRKMVQKHRPDVIFAQEGTPGWIAFFENDPYFLENYTMLYHWRAEGLQVINEGTPLLFKKDRFEFLDGGHFWLSATPDRVSESYEAGEGHIRISSWAKLKEKTTGQVCTFFTTHVDTNGITPMASIKQYTDQFEKMGKDAFAFVGGDYNFTYRGPVYEQVVDWNKFQDMQDIALNMSRAGLCKLGTLKGTLTGGWKDEISPDPNPGRMRQLDYIMAKPNPRFAVDSYEVEYTHFDLPEENVKPGYISDHYGIVAKVRIGTDADYSAYQCRYKEEEGELLPTVL